MAERRRHKKRIQVARRSGGDGGLGRAGPRRNTGRRPERPGAGRLSPRGRGAVTGPRRDGASGRWLGRGGLRSGRGRKEGGAALESRVRLRVPAAEGPGLRGEPASSGARTPGAGLPSLLRVSRALPILRPR